MARFLAGLLVAGWAGAAEGRSFVIQDDSFVKDGEKVQVRSGSIHYSRVHPAYWQDRLERLRAMGLNAITTYVPWNWHEENEGEYNFGTDGRNLTEFVRIAQSLDLMVLLRAGPYMCGEWEFGGFPAWILQKNVTIRTYEPNYIAQVDKYWGKLLGEVVKPLLYSNGGAIVMVQVENEYGSYGDTSKSDSDKKYMEHLVDLANQQLGTGAVVLYTTDGGNTGYMTRGSLSGSSVLTLGDGGWACSAQAEFNPKGLNPCMNTEDYTGWLTHWGENMANTSASDYGAGNAVKSGNSFNFYMGHGGTNFGWFAGANGGGKSFSPHITSYDYDSPVSEGGEHGYGKRGGDKFLKVRTALQAVGVNPPPEPPLLPRKAYGLVTLTDSAPLLTPESLAKLAPNGAKSVGPRPVSMESLGQNYGLVLYTGTAASGGSTLEIEDYPRDRAQVFVNGNYQGAIYRPQAAPLALKSAAKAGDSVSILLEAMGRLNYGRSMTDPKGIITDVTLDGKTAVSNWQASSIPLTYAQVTSLTYQPTNNCSSASGPRFFRGSLTVDGAAADTYLKPRGWGKGIMWVNGKHLGRYWEAEGPQHSFYIPAPFLTTGKNDVILLELEQGAGDCKVEFVDHPDFSGKPATPCDGTPGKGMVLKMRKCDSSLEAQQQWTVTQVNGKSRLSIGGFCLGVGPAKDKQSGQPSAQLHDCSDASLLTLTSSGGPIKDETTGKCLDVTDHGAEAGAPTEWYSCNGGDNQFWTAQDTPSHKPLLVAKEGGKCLSACQ